MKQRYVQQENMATTMGSDPTIVEYGHRFALPGDRPTRTPPHPAMQSAVAVHCLEVAPTENEHGYYAAWMTAHVDPTRSILVEIPSTERCLDVTEIIRVRVW